MTLISPLKAENPINENMEGKKAKPRMKRYGLANSRAGAPAMYLNLNDVSVFVRY